MPSSDQHYVIQRNKFLNSIQKRLKCLSNLPVNNAACLGNALTMESPLVSKLDFLGFSTPSKEFCTKKMHFYRPGLLA